MSRRLALEPVEHRWLLAAPVALNDHYQTLAGQTLEVGQLTNTDTVELIAARSVWKYLDNGSDQGTAWRAPGFNDSDWNSGPAELGYGDGDEATIVDCGPAPGIECSPGNPTIKHITTYFRRQFTVADRSDVQALDVQLNYDDGAVVYLNGVQFARRNMPDGPNFNYQSLAPAAVEDTGEPLSIVNLTGSGLDSLVTGENTIAVEIHQNSLASSDISFDLRLLGAVPASTATGVLANDTDADGDRLSAILESLPDFGTVELAANGSFRYTPADDFTGQDSFTYRASDGANVSTLATVTINVTAPPNSPPVANGDVFTITAGGLVEGNVLSNDTDRDGETLAVVLPLESNVAHGKFTISAEGAFTYRPAANFIGTDRFTYRASDGIGVSNIATVRLVVTPANRPPVVADDHYQALAGQTLVAGQSNDGRRIELIAAGSVWKYLDDGSDQGTAWRAPEFNDSTWNSGPAELGYGDGDEATRVDCGPAEGNECNGGNPALKYITTYFRRQFTVADPSDIQALDVMLNYDDGAIVYLNGVEIARRNMPAGDITYTTAAIAAIEDTTVPVLIANLTGSALVSLVSGENTIAVEIHQQASTSSDISFDFRLNASVFALPPPPGVLANDTDADGDLLMAELVTPPSHGTLQFAADGSFTYRPTDIFAGQDTFTYRANDGASVSDVATVTIDVRDSQENRAPVANPDEYSTPAGQVLRVGGPNDPDGNTTRTLIARGANWRYLDNGTDQGTAWRQLDFNDQSWAAGPAELGYGDGDEVTVVDCGPAPGNECNPGNFENKFITTYFRRHVQIEDPSSLSGVRLGVNFDDGVVVYINGQEVVRRNLPNSDIRFNTLALSAVEDTNVLELMPIEASLFRSGDNVIAAEIHQNHAASSDISFDLEIVAMSSAPLLAGVLANDIDADGDSLTALLASLPAHGTVQFASDGSFVYSPSAGFVGEDSFTYRASDGIAASNVATVTVRVTSDQPVDFPPVALEDHYTLTVGPDTRTLVVPTVEGVLRNDHDPNGDGLSARLIDGPLHGDLDLDLNGGFVYTPAPDFVGIDTFHYRAVDGGDNVSPVTSVTIEVRSAPPSNHPPAAHDDQYQTLAGQTLTVGESNNTDAVELVSAGAVWKYLDNGSDQGTAWRTPNFDDSTWNSGPAQLGYGEQDEATVVAFGSSNEKSITTYFRHRFALNDPAEINGLTLRLLYDDGAVVYVNGQEAVRANMPPGAIGYRTTAATNVQPENTFFEFAISPELLVPGDNFIAVEIHQASPASNDISFDLALEASHSAYVGQGVLANDTDPDADSLTAVLVRGPTHGTVQLRPNGSFTYITDEGFTGVDTFTYQASDGAAASNVATVTITVRPREDNRHPLAQSDEYRLDIVPDRQSLVVSADNGVLANDSDPDNDPLTATLSAGPEHGTVVLRSDGSFDYAPSGDFAGIDTFRYNAIDANGLMSNIATVTIEVRRETPPVREFVVSTTEDEVDGNHSAGDLSLREAILLANTAATVEEMRIVIPAGVYRLTLNGNSEDAAATGDLDLTWAASRIVIHGASAEHTVIDAGGIDRAFHFGSGVTATLENLTIQGGRAGGSGGGIINFGSLLVRQVRLTDNRSREGGAIDNSGSLTVLRSTLDHNEASDDGGAIYSVGNSTLVGSTLAENTAGDSGGGIYAETGRVSVRESTLSANRAADDGGAIYVEAAELFLINSTLSGNEALDGDGGGIDDEAGSIVIENSTINRNRGDLGGGVRSAGGVKIRNTIVAGNSRNGDDGQPNDVYGTFAAGSRYNLIGVIDGSTGLSDVTSHNRFGSVASGALDPRLGPLLDNGGPTKTHAILPGSVALDGGDPNFDPSAFSPELTTDQRGFSRVADVSCRPDRETSCGPIVIVDIGAFELQPADPLPSPGDFNGDRAIDAGDIDLLMDVVRRASAPPTAPNVAVAGAPLAWEISVYDLTSDSIVDHSDANYLIETVLETAYGDVDLDGRVGLRDLAKLRSRLGASSTGWADGDINGDAAVDRADVALLSANLGYRRGSTVLAAAPQAVVQQTRPSAHLAHDAAFARGLSATRRPITAPTADAAIAQPDANDLSAVSRSSALYATRGRASARRDPN